MGFSGGAKTRCKKYPCKGSCKRKSYESTVVRISFLGNRPSCFPSPGWPFCDTDHRKPILWLGLPGSPVMSRFWFFPHDALPAVSNTAWYHSIRESEICFVLRIIKKRNYKLKFSGLTVEKMSFPVIEPVSCLKQSIFWNVGRISDFVDWTVYILKCWTHLWVCGLTRTTWRWYTGSRTLIFLQNGFFSQSLTYTPGIYE